MKHSSSPGAIYRPSDSEARASANVCRSKSDVSSRKNTLFENPSGSQGFKRNDSSPEVVIHLQCQDFGAHGFSFTFVFLHGVTYPRILELYINIYNTIRT